MILVEDGSGLAAAESYATVAFADAHHTARGRETTWTDLDDEVKEAALRAATDYMTVYATRWAGMRSTATQALDWPRAYVPRAASLTGTAYYYDSDVIPVELKKACAELAFRSLTVTLQPDVDAGYPIKRDRVGPLEVEFDTSRGSQAPRFSAIDSMLAPFFLAGTGSGMVRLVRA